MIIIKNKSSIEKMEKAGKLLAQLFEQFNSILVPNKSTLEIDKFIEEYLKEKSLISCSKGYMSYKHSSCISINDEVVHGVPSETNKFKSGDLVKIDICASFEGYCADMARCYFVDGIMTNESKELVAVAYNALDKGIAQAVPNKRIGDISAAIEAEVNQFGFGIVREFAGHGIGKKMHEDPEILNYGKPGSGPLIKAGMAFAIEPMITLGKHDIQILSDGWTVKTVDGKLAAHVEDTVIVLENGPKIITRL